MRILHLHLEWNFLGRSSTEKPRSLYGSTVLLILVGRAREIHQRFVPCLQCNPAKNMAFPAPNPNGIGWNTCSHLNQVHATKVQFPEAKRGIIKREIIGPWIKRPGCKLSTHFSAHGAHRTAPALLLPRQELTVFSVTETTERGVSLFRTPPTNHATWAFGYRNQTFRSCSKQTGTTPVQESFRALPSPSVPKKTFRAERTNQSCRAIWTLDSGASTFFPQKSCHFSMRARKFIVLALNHLLSRV